MKAKDRMTQLKERAYGGKAGVWFSRKKRFSSDNKSEAKAVPPLLHHGRRRRRVMPQRVPLKTSTIESDSQELGETSAGSATGSIVGREKVRSPPIYSDDDDDSEESESEGADGGEMDSKCANRNMGDEDTGSQSRSQQRGWFEQRSTKQSRSYGGTASKRKRTATAAGDEMELSNSTDEMIRFPFASPAMEMQANLSICTDLNSVTKASPMVPLNIAKTAAVSLDDMHPEEDAPANVKRVLVKRRKLFRSAAVRREPVDSNFDTTVDESSRQPSFKTSNEAARAFFERLDATQKLTLDSSDSPSVKGKPCVRTRWKISISDTLLKEEYEKYVAATNDSGVSPLSLKEYADNRSAFFQTKGMYDGFLDG